MSSRNIHVVPSSNGWDVKQEGNPFPLSSHPTQAAALQAAKPLAQVYQVELVTHGRDGRIRDKDSFGSDPFPPKDTRH